MSTQGSSASLTQAARVLNLEWEEAKTHWRDRKSEEFEHTYLEDLSPQISTATTAMEEIEQLLKRVRADCG